MLNWIWLAMMVIAVVFGGFGGRLDVVTEGAFAQARSAVMDIALPFIGMWAIWLGMMRLAERAGLVQALSRALRPILRWLFPDVPADHPAMGAMVLSMSANMLGLSNAATPLGLRAMAHLNRLNPRPGVASNAMITFLTICTASIQLLPTTAISVLALAGIKKGIKSDATAIIGPALIATAAAMCVGIFLARSLARLRIFDPVENLDPAAEQTGPAREEAIAIETIQPEPLTSRGKILLALFFAAFGAMFYTLVCPDVVNHALRSVRESFPAAFDGTLEQNLPASFGGGTWTFGDAWPELAQDGFKQHSLRILRAISLLAIPLMLSFFPLYAALRGVKVYEQFCDGAKESFPTAQRVIPYLVAMLVAMRMLRESGALDVMVGSLKPILTTVGFPPELLPLALMRPLSGSASLGMMTELVEHHGPTSLIGRMAATLYGSTETTFYVIAVYFGSVGVRQTRHAVIAGLSADITATIVTVMVCNWMFS
jgi:spore maturation protein SpmA